MASVPEVLDDFLGVKIWERIAGQNEGIWQAENIQRMDFALCTPGHPEGQHICPHATLLEEVAEFLGISSDEFYGLKHFCGVFRSNIMAGDPYGSWSRRAGHQDTPFRACEALAFMLKRCQELLKIVNVNQYCQTTYSVGFGSNPSTLKIVLEAIGLIQKFQLGQQLIGFFKEKTDLPEVTPRIVELRLENLLQNLSKGVLGKNEVGSIFGDGPERCPVAPKYRHSQFLHVD